MGFNFRVVFMKERWSLNGNELSLELNKNGSSWNIAIEDGTNFKEINISDISICNGLIFLKVNGKTIRLHYTKDSNGSLWISSPTRDSHIEQIAAAKKRGSNKEEGLLAPMPGIILAHKTNAGSNVKKGDPLLVMEAMKMEYTINAPHDGILKRFCFAVGEKAPLGSILAELE